MKDTVFIKTHFSIVAHQPQPVLLIFLEKENIVVWQAITSGEPLKSDAVVPQYPLVCSNP